MAKEFDIYLRKHLVECDLLVYSIPYHDGISATNRLILETALNSYFLYKFTTAQIGSEVKAHIDQMIKLCLEKLSMGAEVGASVDFEALSKLYMENGSIFIDANVMNVLERRFDEVESGLVFVTEPLNTQVGSSTGRGKFPLLVDGGLTGTLKHSLINLGSAVCPNFIIKQINQVDSIGVETPIDIDSILRSLCYNLTFDAFATVEIAALVLGTEVRRSLGVWYNGLTLNSKVTGNWAQKFIAAETVTTIMQEVNGKLIKVLYPQNNSIIVVIPNLNISVKRRRLLSEVDGSRLEDIDDVALGELDYIQTT